MNNKKHVAKYNSEVKVSHSVFNTLHPKLQASILKRKADRVQLEKEKEQRLEEEREQKHETPTPKPSKGERFAELANIHGFHPVGQYLNYERDAVSAISPEMTKKVKEMPSLSNFELKDIIPPLILKLKVGDVINANRSSGYMGDGGDGRDVGYTLKFVIKSINKDHTEFKVEHRQEKYTVKFKPDKQLYLYSIGSPYSWTLPNASVDGLYTSLAEKKEYTSRQRMASALSYEKYLNKQRNLRESKNYEKMTADQLMSIYKRWSQTEHKKIRGITTLKKPQLIEIVKKYNMADSI